MESNHEDIDGCGDRHDVIDDVFEMLNFKIVPKEHGDIGYYGHQHIPSEARIYAAEYCRLNNIIEGIKHENEDLRRRGFEMEGVIATERGKVVERDKQIERIKNEATFFQTKLHERESEVKKGNLRLRNQEAECLELRKLLESQKSVVSTALKETQDARSVIAAREEEVQEHGITISGLRNELEITRKSKSNLESQIEALKTKMLKVTLDYFVSEHRCSDLQAQFKQKSEELVRINEELEKSKQLATTLETQLVEIKQKLEDNDELLKANHNMEKWVKELEAMISKKEETIAKLKKSVEKEKKLKQNLEEKYLKSQKNLSSLETTLEFIVLIAEDLKVFLHVKDPLQIGNNELCESSSSKWSFELLPENVRQSFQYWEETQKTFHEFSTNTKQVLETLMKTYLYIQKRTDVPFPSGASLKSSMVSHITYRDTLKAPGLSDSLPTTSTPVTSSPQSHLFQSLFRLAFPTGILHHTPFAFLDDLDSQKDNGPTVPPPLEDFPSIEQITVASDTPAIVADQDALGVNNSGSPSGMESQGCPTIRIRIPIQKCDQCGKTFTSSKKLRKHQNSAHQTVVDSAAVEDVKPININVNEPATPNASTVIHAVDQSRARKHGIFCKCGLAFQKKNDLQKHVTYFRAKDLFSCPKCTQRFGSTALLRKHAWQSHQIIYELKGCRICGSTFLNRKELRAHQVIKHNLTRKVVTVDLTDASTPAGTPKHIQDENEFGPFPVSKLSKKSSQINRSNLKSTVVRFPAFRQKLWSMRIKKHDVDISKIHLGHYCKCGSSFAESINLKRHITYFRRKRNFQCRLCNRRFATLWHLNEHMKSSNHKNVNHEHSESMSCAICGSKFSTKLELLQHSLAEHPSTPDVSCQETAPETLKVPAVNAFPSKISLKRKQKRKNVKKVTKFTGKSSLNISGLSAQTELKAKKLFQRDNFAKRSMEAIAKAICFPKSMAARTDGKTDCQVSSSTATSSSDIQASKGDEGLRLNGSAKSIECNRKSHEMDEDNRLSVVNQASQ